MCGRTEIAIKATVLMLANLLLKFFWEEGMRGGGIAGVGDGSSTLVTHMGGGIDLPMRSGISIRIIQADHYLTDFANSVNDHQNNLWLSAGIALHWSRLKQRLGWLPLTCRSVRILTATFAPLK
jgi:hypothetical protein